LYILILTLSDYNKNSFPFIAPSMLGFVVF
jgi:hypothetical protein